MFTTDRMNVDEHSKYSHKIRIRYWQAEERTKKSWLVTEMVAVSGLHRKSLLRLLDGDLARKHRR